jgi:hypothetical protein
LLECIAVDHGDRITGDSAAGREAHDRKQNGAERREGTDELVHDARTLA